MSFEDFSREARESWNEVGLVYTRNKYGRVCSPPGYQLNRKNDFSFKRSLFRGLYNNKNKAWLKIHIKCVFYRKF